MMKKIYPRTGDTQTVYLNTVVKDPSIEFGGALIREYPVQSLADFTQVVHKHGVFLLTACFEVHVNAVLR